MLTSFLDFYIMYPELVSYCQLYRKERERGVLLHFLYPKVLIFLTHYEELNLSLHMIMYILTYACWSFVQPKHTKSSFIFKILN